MPTIMTAAKTRRRARLAVNHTANGIIIGFNEWRSNFIIDIKECPVIKIELMKIVEKLRECLIHWLPRGEKCDVQLTSLNDGVDILLIGGPALELDQRQTLAEIASFLEVAHLSWKKWDRSPAEPIAYKLPLGITFGKTRISFPAGSFIQATASGEKALIEFAKSICKSNSNVLDLFCGLGTFGLSMDNTKSVHFVDLDGPSIDALNKKAKQNNNFNVELRNLINNPLTAGECNDYDLVIFDPPRGGAKEQSKHLAKSNVKDIIAVSCDPSTFARDAKILIDGEYKMKSILPVDQFLWSTHIECIAHFTRD
jgi:23S rRNA (uracil1939-C5)-methyltransferase